MYGVLKECTVHDLAAEKVLLLAQDVKVMLQTLRTYRRQWLWLAKKTNLEWPPVASKYPHCLSIVKDMTGDAGQQQDDEGEREDSVAEIHSEAQELAAMWAVPDSIEEQILKKRKTVIEELQHTTVLLHGSSDEEQPPATAPPEAARSSGDSTPPAPSREPNAPTREPKASAETATWQHLGWFSDPSIINPIHPGPGVHSGT